MVKVVEDGEGGVRAVKVDHLILIRLLMLLNNQLGRSELEILEGISQQEKTLFSCPSDIKC